MKHDHLNGHLYLKYQVVRVSNFSDLIGFVGHAPVKSLSVPQAIYRSQHDLVFQIEVPIEVIMFHMMPPVISNIVFGSILGLIKLLNPKIPVGIHLCLGDLNNESLAKISTLKSLVKFSNKLVDRLPATHKLEFMHFPLAEGKEPPVVEDSFYDELKKVKLPANTRFIAGFVHEKLSMEQHKHLLKNIENIRGERIEIACSCGMGRRTTEAADQLLNIKKELVEMD